MHHLSLSLSLFDTREMRVLLPQNRRLTVYKLRYIYSIFIEVARLLLNRIILHCVHTASALPSLLSRRDISQKYCRLLKKSVFIYMSEGSYIKSTYFMIIFIIKIQFFIWNFYIYRIHSMICVRYFFHV